MNLYTLNSIRNEIKIYLEDGIIRTDSFNNFCDDFYLINKSDDEYKAVTYIQYLKKIFDEVKKGSGEHL